MKGTKGSTATDCDLERAYMRRFALVFESLHFCRLCGLNFVRDMKLQASVLKLSLVFRSYKHA